MLVRGSKAFGVNLLLLLAFHWVPPLAFIVPVLTGYVSGWNARVTLRQGAAIGFIMGLWMLFVCALATAFFVVASLMYPGGLKRGAELGISLLVGFLVLHIALFGAAGAMLGGHFRRRERDDPDARAPA
jgi:hypothetical protein